MPERTVDPVTGLQDASISPPSPPFPAAIRSSRLGAFGERKDTDANIKKAADTASAACATAAAKVTTAPAQPVERESAVVRKTTVSQVRVAFCLR